MKATKFDPGPNPFVLGAPVAVERGGNDEPYRRMVVAVILKNGNVKLAPAKEPKAVEAQQYRLHGNRGHSTGGSFSGTIVRPWTPAIEAEQKVRVAKHRHVSNCRTLYKALSDPANVPADLAERLVELVNSWPKP